VWIIWIVALILVATAFTKEPLGWFPLGRSWAGETELPRPLGIGLNIYQQNQDYILSSLILNIPDIDPIQASGISIKNRTTEKNLKLDLWLLPFLNVFGIVGSVDGKTTVALETFISELEIAYNGTVYGGGVTLAAGKERLFGSLTATYSETNLDTTASSVYAWVFTPKAGIQLRGNTPTKGLFVWIGAMYQQTDEEHSGCISLPPAISGFDIDAIEYKVVLEEKTPWNYLAGMCAAFTRRLQLELEGGLGNRKHATASLVYRL